MTCQAKRDTCDPPPPLVVYPKLSQIYLKRILIREQHITHKNGAGQMHILTYMESYI